MYHMQIYNYINIFVYKYNILYIIYYMISYIYYMILPAHPHIYMRAILRGHRLVLI